MAGFQGRIQGTIEHCCPRTPDRTLITTSPELSLTFRRLLGRLRTTTTQQRILTAVGRRRQCGASGFGQWWGISFLPATACTPTSRKRAALRVPGVGREHPRSSRLKAPTPPTGYTAGWQGPNEALLSLVNEHSHGQLHSSLQCYRRT
jgi:hypothetical protein